jgi:hypothetical protein
VGRLGLAEPWELLMTILSPQQAFSVPAMFVCE